MNDSQESVFALAIQSFLGPVMPYLLDATVSEILINGPTEIFIERKGKLEKTNSQFSGEDALQAVMSYGSSDTPQDIPPPPPPDTPSPPEELPSDLWFFENTP